MNRATRTVACVGTRYNVPAHIISEAEYIGYQLNQAGIEVYSGHAVGMDQAFERGCEAFYNETGTLGLFKAFLPKVPFCGATPTPSTGWYEAMATRDHIDGDNILSRIKGCETGGIGDRSFRSDAFRRNVLQVRKRNGEYVEAVCYYAEEDQGVVSGGTRVAVYIGRRGGVPTYNLGIAHERAKFYEDFDIEPYSGF